MSTNGRRHAAKVLTNALADLRANDRARNWLTGYSLAEALDERIKDIGTVGGERKIGGRFTRIGKLEDMRDTVSALVDSAEFNQLFEEPENV